MNILASSGWNAAVKGITDAHQRATAAANNIARDPSLERITEAKFELNKAQVQQAANLQVIKSLDENQGSLLDIAA